MLPGAKLDREPSLFGMPCLKCGDRTVYVGLFFGIVANSDELPCRNCDTRYFLMIEEDDDGALIACYQRYTLRYPLESYDEGEIPTLARISVSAGDEERDDGYGPLLIFPRIAVTRAVRRAVWQRSNGKCHICDRPWKLSAHGRRGWHADHVEPHCQGGSSAETVDNLLVACARCNLKRGPGYTAASIRKALTELVDWIRGE